MPVANALSRRKRGENKDGVHQPKEKISCLGVLFLFARLHVARALAVPRRESSVESKLTRALWDTAADCARSLGVFFLPKEGAGDSRSSLPRRWLHWRCFAHLTVVVV